MAEPGGVVKAGSGGSPVSAESGRSLRSAPRAVMYAHPWALRELGAERAIADLRERGFDAVQLAFTYHAAAFLTPRQPQGKLRFGLPGVLNFLPEGSARHPWPFRPPVAPEVGEGHPVPELLRQLSAGGLQAVAWVVFLYNHSLAGTMPELSVENAFGDRHGAQLCPANPRVRAYVEALAHDVVAFEPLAGLWAESLSYLPFEYGALNLKTALVPGRGASRLLSVCFCQHCREAGERANVDTGRLREAVVRALGDNLTSLPDPVEERKNLADLLPGAVEELLRYRSAQREVVVSLHASLAALSRAHGLRYGTNAGEGGDDFVSVAPNDSLRAFRSEYRFGLRPGLRVTEVRGAVDLARERAGAGVPIYALVQLGGFRSEEELLRTLGAATAAGVRHFRFYEFSVLSARQLDWLREASVFWKAPL